MKPLQPSFLSPHVWLRSFAEGHGGKTLGNNKEFIDSDFLSLFPTLQRFQVSILCQFGKVLLPRLKSKAKKHQYPALWLLPACWMQFWMMFWVWVSSLLPLLIPCIWNSSRWIIPKVLTSQNTLQKLKEDPVATREDSALDTQLQSETGHLTLYCHDFFLTSEVWIQTRAAS